MSDWPDIGVPPLGITSYDRFFNVGRRARALNLGISNPASATWPGANITLYMEFQIPWPYPIKRVFLANGATVSGNFDIGILTKNGDSIQTLGTTAQSGTNVVQYANFSLLLDPGSYFLALGMSSATATVFGSSTVTSALGQAMGVKQQATYPVPTSAATFASYASSNYPVCGFTQTESL